MIKAGFVMAGRRATKAEATEWLKANPDFVPRRAHSQARIDRESKTGFLGAEQLKRVRGPGGRFCPSSRHD
jgi:hypothetical protein